jgi:peptidoglycan/LPS O-acetylase OafA/YrhL
MVMHRAPTDTYSMIDTLTGLRAFAALWVFSRHFFAGSAYDVGFGTKIYIGIASYVAILGGWGVDVFFVLSGFVMMHVYETRFSGGLKRSAVTRFYALRLGRIYPLHVAILGAMAVGYALDVLPSDGKKFQGAGLLVNLLLVHCWGFYDTLVWNRPSWSISAEWFVYLLFPFFVAAFGSIRKAWQLLLAIAVLFVLYHEARWEIGGFTRGNLGPGSLLRVTFGFLAGFFLYGLFKRRFLQRIDWDAVCLSAIVGYVALMILSFGRIDLSLVFHLAICVIVFSVACSSRYAARIFNNRVSMYLGEISYSIYMVHFPLLRFLTHNFGSYFETVAAEGSQLILWLLALAVLGLVIGMSSICYHVIEVPCRDYVKRRVLA